jgi:hypothetical protein
MLPESTVTPEVSERNFRPVLRRHLSWSVLLILLDSIPLVGLLAQSGYSELPRPWIYYSMAYSVLLIGGCCSVALSSGLALGGRLSVAACYRFHGALLMLVSVGLIGLAVIVSVVGVGRESRLSWMPGLLAGFTWYSTRVFLDGRRSPLAQQQPLLGRRLPILMAIVAFSAELMLVIRGLMDSGHL